MYQFYTQSEIELNHPDRIIVYRTCACKLDSFALNVCYFFLICLTLHQFTMDFTLTLSLSLSLSLFCARAHSLSLSLSPSPLFLTYSHNECTCTPHHTYTHSLSLSLSHTHTHTHTHSLIFSCSDNQVVSQYDEGSDDEDAQGSRSTRGAGGSKLSTEAK